MTKIQDIRVQIIRTETFTYYYVVTTDNTPRGNFISQEFGTASAARADFVERWI